MTRVRKLFSPDDLAAVEAAVERAEETTSGEIAAVIADESDRYRGAAWKGALLGALAASLVTALWAGSEAAWGRWLQAWIALAPLAGSVVGFGLAASFDPVRRVLVDSQVMEERVEGRAAEAFLDEEVFATRDRTGILMFVSLFERRLIVLPDRGIRTVISRESWGELAERFGASARREGPRAALLEALQGAGDLLRTTSAGAGDDVDELANRPRVVGPAGGGRDRSRSDSDEEAG